MERSKQSAIAIIICIAVSNLCTPAPAKIIYVDDDASGLANGSSWQNAFDTVQDALAAARTMGQPVEVRVAQGIYTPDRGVNQIPGDDYATFKLVEGVVLKGGYAGVLEPDPNARDVQRHHTTLSGDLLGDDVPVKSPYDLLDEPTRSDNSRHVVIGTQISAATVLDGFTITGGSHPWFPGRGDSWGGPGVYLYRASPTLANCRLHGNCSRGGTGGALVNYAGSEPTVVNCIFSGNLASYGGAIGNWGSSNAKVINCTFHNNWAYWGGAIFNHCVVSNSILWGNVPTEIGETDGGPDTTYSDVAGGWPGEGNLDVDPCFADPGYRTDNGTPGDLRDDASTDGDCHLKSQGGRWDPNSQRWFIDDVTSPCIDAGDPNSFVGDEPSPNGRRINMGAYGGIAEASKSYPFKDFQERLQGLPATIEGQSDEEPLIYKWSPAVGFLHHERAGQ